MKYKRIKTKNQPDSSRRIYSPQAAKAATITSRNQTEFDATLKPRSKFIKIRGPNRPSKFAKLRA